MPADLVLSATPIDLTRVLKLDKPVVRVRYELEELAGRWRAVGRQQSNLTASPGADRRAGTGRLDRRDREPLTPERPS